MKYLSWRLLYQLSPAIVDFLTGQDKRALFVKPVGSAQQATGGKGFTLLNPAKQGRRRRHSTGQGLFHHSPGR